MSLAIGQGITGRAAAEPRPPVQSPDVTVDPRFSWVRGFDIARPPRDAVGAARLERGRSSACSTSRRPRPASSTREEVEFLVDDRGAARRDRREGPDAGRGRGAARPAEPARRRPRGAARASSPTSSGRRWRSSAPTSTCSPTPRRANAAEPPADPSRTGAPARPTRSRGSTGSSTRSSPRCAARASPGLRREPFDVVGAIAKTVGTLALLLRTRPVRWEPPHGCAGRPRRRRALPPGARAPARQRGQVRAAGAGRLPRRVARRTTRSRSTSPTTGRACRSRTGRPCSSRTCGSTGRGHAARGSGCSPARRLMEAMGGRVWIERNGYGGSRFMVALPAASSRRLGRVSPGWRRAGPRRGGARSRASRPR